jgi:hypothetical protein
MCVGKKTVEQLEIFMIYLTDITGFFKHKIRIKLIERINFQALLINLLEFKLEFKKERVFA